MAYSLTLALIVVVWARYIYKENRHFIQYKPYAKQDEINLSCIEIEDDKVIKFLMALTLYVWWVDPNMASSLAAL